jgi:hypothetical protein
MRAERQVDEHRGVETEQRAWHAAPQVSVSVLL